MSNFLGINSQATFDIEKVLDPTRKARRRWLFQNAGLVRTISRRSMRRTKKISADGSPPAVHAGGLKAGILFAVENEMAVIGPELRNSRAARALEHGGPSSRVNRQGKRRRFVVKSRPFMRPALEAATPKLPAGWRGAISR